MCATAYRSVPNRLLVVSPLVCVAILLATIGFAADAPKNPPQSRRDFAKAMSQLKEGMPQTRALELLGKPDDIRTEHDGDGISTVGTREIWRYGTSGHLSPATLGQVYIDDGGEIQYVYGAGDPPPDGMFTEADLRRLIAALADVPSYNGGDRYNPLKVIRAVNLLQPLGKEKALAAVQEFLRVSSTFDDDGREGTFLVLRTLFDVPADPGHFPAMMVGAPVPAPPKDQKALPRFPIAIVGNVPLLLVGGYSLAGQAEPPEWELDYFCKTGTIRSKPLAPTDNPFKALDEFRKSRQWIFAGQSEQQADRAFDSNEDEFDLLCNQMLSLLDSVFRVAPGDFGELMPSNRDADNADRRKEILAKASNLKIRWDAKQQKYTFLDGTSLPEPPAKQYRRELWWPEVPESKVKVAIVRQNPRVTTISLVENGISSKRILIKVWDVAVKSGPVATIEGGSSKSKLQPRTVELTTSGDKNVIRSSSQRFDLADGSQIKLELIVDGKSQYSEVYKP